MRTIREYRESYAQGKSVRAVMRELWEEIQTEEDEGIFITKFSWEQIEAQLGKEGELAGIPFVVKDNIDIAGVLTTAGCPAYGYVAEETAPVVRLLQEAGAVCFGKTNLDQFATGLVGVRTPYPVPKNPFDADYLPGGSSCGSAVAVARGLAVFSLGTDTAGSGRVPAAYNELVGLKPTRGYLSTRGVVDACKSLDCVSVFANSCADADEVFRVTARVDFDEAFSRKVPAKWPRFGKQFSFGVPKAEQMHFYGWDEARGLFEDAAKRFEEMGGRRVEIDLEPFMLAARLLYEGPWVTERFVAIRGFLAAQPEEIFPVTRGIIEGGELHLASALFEAQYKLADCRRLATREMEGLDFVMVPTTPRNFTLKEIEEKPVLRNSIIGTYTNFMNLLDFAAVALPAGRYQGRLPWGITIFGEAGTDRALMEVGARYERGEPAGGDWDEVRVAVCGAHLEGMPLNWQLADRGGRFLRAGKTAASYRMYLIPKGGGLPERPALIFEEGGESIELEIWTLSREAFGEFVSTIPAPLGIGKVLLDDGSEVSGFIAEPRSVPGARDLTRFGGWRAYFRDEG
jgi:allophanate hydrolase